MTITELLRQDHRHVEDLFARFDEGEDTSIPITSSLQRHDEIESKILYPEMDLHEEMYEKVQHAREEHMEIKKHIDMVLTAKAAHDDAATKAQVHALKEVVEHHVMEEENELFPMVESHIDAARLEEMGTQAEEM